MSSRDPGAEPAQVLLVVTDEEERAPFGEELVDAAVALLPEGLVADGEHLVDEEDGFVELRDHREREAHLHPVREVLVGHVDEVGDLGEADDVIEAPPDLRLRHPVQAGGEPDVLLTVRSPTKPPVISMRARLPVHLDGALIGQQHSGDQRGASTCPGRSARRRRSPHRDGPRTTRRAAPRTRPGASDASLRRRGP